jgi:hypothetical protein
LPTVFAGSRAPFFLAEVFRAPLPSLLVHIHGAAFSCWMILLITQVAGFSRTVGDSPPATREIWPGLLDGVSGVSVASKLLARDVSPVPVFDAKMFYVIVTSEMVVFATLIFFAYRFRSPSIGAQRAHSCLPR